jgi:apolipoprotein N-acyltransferase
VTPKKRIESLLRTFWGPALVHALLLLGAFHPLDQGWLAVPAWMVLLASMRLRGGEKAGRQAFAGAAVFFLVGLYWTAPIWFPGWLITVAYCAGWEALFGWGLGRLFRRGSASRRWLWVLAAPAGHLLVDMLRTVVFSGFPWFLTGYAGWDNPVLIGSADLMGVHGATLALLVLAAALTEAFCRRLMKEDRPAFPLLAALVVWGGLAGWSLSKPPIETRPGPRVAVLQGNILQRTKEDLESAGQERMSREDWVGVHTELIDAAHEQARTDGRPLDAVIWPETMFPPLRPRWYVNLPLTDARNAQLPFPYMARFARGASTLAGVVSFAPEDGTRRNSVVLVDPEGKPLGIQHKQHLTPGGETLLIFDYLPEALRRWLEEWLEDWAGYVPTLAAGQSAAPLDLPTPDGSAAVGVVICYECLFPELTREMTLSGADFLLNASNYGWFAGSPEMEQALVLCAFRAAETRRALVIASNNGVSALIGPDGRVIDVLAVDGVRADVRGFLVADVPLASGTTPFVATGEWTAWILGLLGWILGALAARAERTS